MVENFSSTVIDAIRHASRSGQVIAHDDVIRHRITTCTGCDRKTGARCLECGCYINLKTAVAVAKCPLGKW